jgi:hypothetical protein
VDERERQANREAGEADRRSLAGGAHEHDKEEEGEQRFGNEALFHVVMMGGMFSKPVAGKVTQLEGVSAVGHEPERAGSRNGAGDLGDPVRNEA